MCFLNAFTGVLGDKVNSNVKQFSLNLHRRAGSYDQAEAETSVERHYKCPTPQ